MSQPQTPTRLEHVQENFVRHIVPLRAFVYALVLHRQLVDDIVQETFVTACQKADSYEPGTNFRAWIFSIARFKVIGTVRTARRGLQRLELLEPEVIDLLAGEWPTDLEVQDRVAALDGCVAKLATTARQAVVLRYLENMGPTEIAARLGWTVNALNVALSRARGFLRRCVEETLRAGKVC